MIAHRMLSSSVVVASTAVALIACSSSTPTSQAPSNVARTPASSVVSSTSPQPANPAWLNDPAVASAHWSARYPTAAFELASWARDYPALEARLRAWEDAQPDHVQTFTDWLAMHPYEVVDHFLADRPDSSWTPLVQILGDAQLRDGMDEYAAWTRRHPVAARELAEYPRAIDWAAHEATAHATNRIR